MAEVTPGRGRAEKEIILFEDFESIAYHAKVGATSGARSRRSAEAAFAGHAGLELFTPAAAGAYATATWTTTSSKQPLIGLSYWCKTPSSIPAGFLTTRLIIQKADIEHTIGIRYNFSTQDWEYLDETKTWVSFPEVTAVIGVDIWTRIGIEVNTNTGRVIAVHVNEQSFRMNRAYSRIANPASTTYMTVEIRVDGSDILAITLYVDNLSVQEL
jgi:hypothetical protein